MKKLLMSALLTLGLASCGTNPVQPSLVYDLGNAYGVLQSAAVAYTKLPRCSATLTTLCSKATVVVALAQYDKNAVSALKTAESYVRNPANYPGVTLASVINGAQTAVTILQTFESSNGVK